MGKKPTDSCQDTEKTHTHTQTQADRRQGREGSSVSKPEEAVSFRSSGEARGQYWLLRYPGQEKEKDKDRKGRSQAVCSSLARLADPERILVISET